MSYIICGLTSSVDVPQAVWVKVKMSPNVNKET